MAAFLFGFVSGVAACVIGVGLYFVFKVGVNVG